MWRLADPYGACAGGYHELSAMRDRFHWARLLAFVTGLVNQELLLRNEYLAAENRILRAHLPSWIRFSDAERSTLAEVPSDLVAKLCRMSRALPGRIPFSSGIGDWWRRSSMAPAVAPIRPPTDLAGSGGVGAAIGTGEP